MTTIKLIGLTGRAGSGKSTVAQHLVDRHQFARISLADPIRNGLAAMLPISTNCLIDRDLKEKPLDALCGKSPRQAMQTLGTEWGRQLIGKDIWLKVAQSKINYLRSTTDLRGIVVDDVRFEDEAEWIRNQGGEIWHMYRHENPYGTDIQHESENGVIKLLDDPVLQNLHDFAYLKSQVNKFMHRATK